MEKDVHTPIVDFFLTVLPTRPAPHAHAAQHRHCRLLPLPVLNRLDAIWRHDDSLGRRTHPPAIGIHPNSIPELLCIAACSVGIQARKLEP
jgi:hypothetical protein